MIDIVGGWVGVKCLGVDVSIYFTCPFFVCLLFLFCFCFSGHVHVNNVQLRELVYLRVLLLRLIYELGNLDDETRSVDL